MPVSRVRAVTMASGVLSTHTEWIARTVRSNLLNLTKSTFD